MTIAAARVNGAVLAVFEFLTLTFVALTIGIWSQTSAITKLGGWLGLITAALAWYASCAGVVNSTWKRTLLPVFPLAPAQRSRRGEKVTVGEPPALSPESQHLTDLAVNKLKKADIYFSRTGREEFELFVAAGMQEYGENARPNLDTLVDKIITVAHDEGISEIDASTWTRIRDRICPLWGWC